MSLNEFDFVLPRKSIAQYPVSPRDYAKLLYYSKSQKSLEYGHFFDLPRHLGPGDVLVLNNTKVVPARICFSEDGRQHELLILSSQKNSCNCLVWPGKKFRIGDVHDVYGAKITVLGIRPDGTRDLHIEMNESLLADFMHKYGEMPVPPYIEGKKYLDTDYNTVYSNREGSVAAPTAGLHFTRQLLARLQSLGVEVEYVTLDVGMGTFLPIKEKDPRRHQMHSENYQISHTTARRLNNHLGEGKRLIAVGTTSVRTLEDNFGRFGQFRDGQYTTEMFITPGYRWKAVGGMITNFHLPKSTLLMLVAAMIGQEETLHVYQRALVAGFRFYSFGDAMLII